MNETTRSLFVVSLPRSLSSIVYQAARASLGLYEPSWTSEGEFLNADRYVLVPGPVDDMCRKFTTESEKALFKKITEFMNQVVVPHGFAYKDVVQPFVVSQWIKKNLPPTLKVKRNIADVAFSMLDHKWHYPGRLFPKAESVESAVVQGLIRAQDVLDSIPGVEVDFDQLVSDEELLYSTLSSLYGGGAIMKRPKYIDRKFRDRRNTILERRNTREYGAVVEYVNRAKKSSLFSRL